MAKIKFILADETEQTVVAEHGESLMRAAVENDIAGIEAECGGCMMCATCHVYVESDPNAAAAQRSDGETEMLEVGVTNGRPNSRLSCQIVVDDSHDGLVVRIPEEDHQ